MVLGERTNGRESAWLPGEAPQQTRQPPVLPGLPPYLATVALPRHPPGLQPLQLLLPLLLQPGRSHLLPLLPPLLLRPQLPLCPLQGLRKRREGPELGAELLPPGDPLQCLCPLPGWRLAGQKRLVFEPRFWELTEKVVVAPQKAGETDANEP